MFAAFWIAAQNRIATFVFKWPKDELRHGIHVAFQSRKNALVANSRQARREVPKGFEMSSEVYLTLGCLEVTGRGL
jgi:hypothetical protein